jgi:IclR family acetate operon transcriptional repressor
MLGRTDTGLGLTELSRATGLAKTTVHRLAEQLVAGGAAPRIERRDFVGPAIARIGRRWEPDPQLRQAACGPVRTLARVLRTAAAVYVLHEGRALLVTATVCRGQSWVPPAELDAPSIARTAIGRVLLGSDRAVVPPDQHRHRLDLRDWRAVVADQDATGGFCWIAAPVLRPDGRRAAAVAALVAANITPPGVKSRLLCAALQIGQHLR